VAALLDPNVGPVVLEALSEDLRIAAVREFRAMVDQRCPPAATPRVVASTMPAFLRDAARRMYNADANSSNNVDALLIAICSAKTNESNRSDGAAAVRASADAARAADPDADPDDRVRDDVGESNVNLDAIHIDAIRFYTHGAGAEFRQLAPIALEMMTMASGEAACERMFSKAGYFDADRRDFAPRTLTMLTMCKYYPNVE